MTAGRAGVGMLIVGSGQAAGCHARLLAKHHRNVSLMYWGRSAEPARALAAKYGGERVLGDWEEAVANERVDAVFITTPPDTHCEIAVTALEAGKHVIVEKPAFLDTAEFDLVEAAAARHGRQVLVAENYLYKPLLRAIRAQIRSGVLGQVRFVAIDAVKRQIADGWRADPARAGGGALMESGIHWVAFMDALGLSIRRAEAFFPDAPGGQERSVTFVAEYEEGAVGVLNHSWEIPGLLKGLRLSRIYGTRSSLLFESNGLFLLRGHRALSFPGISDMLGYRAMLAEFVRVLTTGAEPEFTIADARRCIELIQYTYSADRGMHP